jgi:hypothetical protein
MKVTILGGGPSARPWIGKVTGPCIGVNQAALYQKVHWCIWVDRTWWTKWGEAVRKTGTEMWTVREMYPSHVNVLPVKVSNSGAAAIHLAMHLGFNEIHLIGFDFTCVNGEPNFHSDYTRVTHSPKWYVDTWGKDFQRIADLATEKGVKIFNLNPQSNLTLFPFLEQSTSL